MIKNIIFDFGNVLLNLDSGATARKMQALLGAKFDEAYAKLQQARVFELYEVGGLSTEEFVDALRFSVSPALNEAEVIEAWNAVLLDFPPARMDMLLRLRARYQVFLLSNINDLHARFIDDYMLREHGMADFQTRFFDAVYYSHLIRLRKPNREIYEYVLADAELVPEETVFFDDMQVNIDAACRVGIKGIWHSEGTEIIEKMQDFL
jgi:FMN phosphatase YigB (HAD superfamily)